MTPTSDEDVHECARCGVELQGERVIVLKGSLVIMFCSTCGKNEARAITRSGTHALELEAIRRTKTR
jgi:hypothetical protein